MLATGVRSSHRGATRAGSAFPRWRLDCGAKRACPPRSRVLPDPLRRGRGAHACAGECARGPPHWPAPPVHAPRRQLRWRLAAVRRFRRQRQRQPERAARRLRHLTGVRRRLRRLPCGVVQLRLDDARVNGVAGGLVAVGRGRGPQRRGRRPRQQRRRLQRAAGRGGTCQCRPEAEGDLHGPACRETVRHFQRTYWILLPRPPCKVK